MLYVILTIYPLTKIINCIFLIYYWLIYSRTGTSFSSFFFFNSKSYTSLIKGIRNDIREYLNDGNTILYSIVFYGILLLLSTGWRINRKSIENQKYLILGLN